MNRIFFVLALVLVSPFRTCLKRRSIKTRLLESSPATALVALTTHGRA